MRVNSFIYKWDVLYFNSFKKIIIQFLFSNILNSLSLVFLFFSSLLFSFMHHSFLIVLDTEICVNISTNLTCFFNSRVNKIWADHTLDFIRGVIHTYNFFEINFRPPFLIEILDLFFWEFFQGVIHTNKFVEIIFLLFFL